MQRARRGQPRHDVFCDWKCAMKDVSSAPGSPGEVPASSPPPANPSQRHYLHQELIDSLAEDEGLLDWLERSALDGLWFWDLVDQDQEWLSPTFKALFGYEDHEIPNTSTWWQENIFKEDLPGVLETARLHLEEGEPYDQVVRYRHKDGSTVWVRCRGCAIRDDNDRPIRMLGAHTDVTQLKLAEGELRQRTRELEDSVDSLKRSNRELEELLRVISHDLREPLRAARLFSRLVRDRYGDDLDDQARDYLDRAIRGNDRLDLLLSDLLDHSRMRTEMNCDATTSRSRTSFTTRSRLRTGGWRSRAPWFAWPKAWMKPRRSRQTATRCPEPSRTSCPMPSSSPSDRQKSTCMPRQGHQGRTPGHRSRSSSRIEVWESKSLRKNVSSSSFNEPLDVTSRGPAPALQS